MNDLTLALAIEIARHAGVMLQAEFRQSGNCGERGRMPTSVRQWRRMRAAGWRGVH